MPELFRIGLSDKTVGEQVLVWVLLLQQRLFTFCIGRLDMDSILLYLAAGILAGRFLFPRKRRQTLLRCGRYLQAMGVCISLFVMGITLGESLQSREALLCQGVTALGFAASAAAGSGVFAWLLVRWEGWLGGKHSYSQDGLASESSQAGDKTAQAQISGDEVPKDGTAAGRSDEGD